MQENLRFCCYATVKYTAWEDRTDTGLFQSLRSIPVNRWSSNMYWCIVLMRMLQARMCGFIKAHPGLPHQKTKH